MFQVNPLLDRIHMKYEALFFSEDKSKKLKCCLLQCFVGALRVKGPKKIAADFYLFYFYLSKKIRLDRLAEDSHEILSFIYSEKQ